MMKDSIIITGVSGFIGSALARYLAKEYKIIGIDREHWKDFNKLYEKHKDIVFFERDINDDLPGFSEGIYAVIHLAASAGVRESMDNFEQFAKNNILGTKNILDKCVNDWNPQKLLVASSSSIYENKSPYALSKIATEKLIESYKNNGLLSCIISVILRIYTTYGPGQRKGLAIRDFIDNILQDKPITVFGDGSQSRAFLYIDDLCRTVDSILSKTGYYDYDEILNVTSGELHTINETIRLICELTNKSVTIKYEPFNRFDAMTSKVSNCWVPYPHTNFKIGLENQIEWQKKELGIKD